MNLPDGANWQQPIARILVGTTGISSGGYPYLDEASWEMFRDRVPHLFSNGLHVLRMLARDDASLLPAGNPLPDPESSRRARAVMRQIVLTASVTAPPDLWLLAHVLGTYRRLGLTERLLAGERLAPDGVWVGTGRAAFRADPHEIDADLSFLHARGLVDMDANAYVAPSSPSARQVLAHFDHEPGPHRSGEWASAFAGNPLPASCRERLLAFLQIPEGLPPRTEYDWIPTLEEIHLGSRLLPIVLGMRIAERGTPEVGRPIDFGALDAKLHDAVATLLRSAGAIGPNGAVTEWGERVFSKGPGPFGIIEAYHPYMDRLADLLAGSNSHVHVARDANVARSQDANRLSFEKSNHAIDRFCRDTGFQFSVFIEHAVGRGEATRQRFARAPYLRYFGADLEDAAIDAALSEQRQGLLPPQMLFLRQTDIGEPDALLLGLRNHQADPKDAVMIVGNGFHEIRHQTDEKMISVFRRYAEAGLVVVFTEESALSVEDLRRTAFNTYHAGFRYVHEKSGQGLRPAEPSQRSPFSSALRTSWRECAERGGFRCLEKYSTRGRTIYPSPRADGHNPSVSVNHFLVPQELATRLGC